MPSGKKSKQGQQTGKKRFTDEQTDKRNHEHLLNEKDEISEDDIRNVKTDISSMDEQVVPDKLIGDDLANEKVKDDEDPEIDSSWDVLEK